MGIKNGCHKTMKLKGNVYIHQQKPAMEDVAEADFGPKLSV